MTGFRKPPRILPGMTVGVVAPSSPLSEQDDLDRDVAALETLGVRVVLGAHVRDRRGYLAGRDDDRAADLHDMLERPDVDAVLCMGGGYGSHRTALALDLPRLRRLRSLPPKPFVGYSDITVLHALLQRELGWTTFYGPMLRGWARQGEETIGALRSTLMEGDAPVIAALPAGAPVEVIRGGRAEGRVLGGCLSLLAALVGTPWEVDFRDAIFLWEDIDEQPYRIDRMLAHLLAAGKLAGCKGVVVGELVRCEPDDPVRSLALSDVLHDLLAPLGVPVLYGLPVGHGPRLLTVPLGARAELDADRGHLRFTEPGVE